MADVIPFHGSGEIIIALEATWQQASYCIKIQLEKMVQLVEVALSYFKQVAVKMCHNSASRVKWFWWPIGSQNILGL